MSWREFDKDDIITFLGLNTEQAKVLEDLIKLCNRHGIDISDLEAYLDDLRFLEDLSQDDDPQEPAISAYTWGGLMAL